MIVWFNEIYFYRLDGGLRKPSLEVKHPPEESDTESIADYADGTDAGRVYSEYKLSPMFKDRFRVKIKLCIGFILLDMVFAPD